MKDKREPRPIQSSKNSPTPREIYIREQKEEALTAQGLDITEENMKRVTIQTKWETM